MCVIGNIGTIAHEELQSRRQGTSSCAATHVNTHFKESTNRSHPISGSLKKTTIALTFLEGK